MATATKKEEAYSWKAGASSRHTTNLKQSILRLSISMGLRERERQTCKQGILKGDR
jgi:hypothetical protein